MIAAEPSLPSSGITFGFSLPLFGATLALPDDEPGNPLMLALVLAFDDSLLLRSSGTFCFRDGLGAWAVPPPPPPPPPLAAAVPEEEEPALVAPELLLGGFPTLEGALLL